MDEDETMMEPADPGHAWRSSWRGFATDRNLTLPALGGRRRRLGAARLRRGRRSTSLAERGVLHLAARGRSRRRRTLDAVARGTRLLTASFVDTGDAAFALHPQTGDLYLRILRGLDGLDYDEFEDLVDSIARTADRWDDELAEEGMILGRSSWARTARRRARSGRGSRASIRGGDAVALVGDLGAGKTTFVAGFAAALGAEATSPTFALVNDYRRTRACASGTSTSIASRAQAKLPELGLDDLVGNPRGVLLVEWADRFAVLPADHTKIALPRTPATGGARWTPWAQARAGASSPGISRAASAG